MKLAIALQRVLLPVITLLLSTALNAAQIVGLRSSSSTDSTRLVLELDAPVESSISEESTPGRLVILLPKVSTQLAPSRWPARVGPLLAARLDSDGGTPRLLLDLRQEVDPKVFALGPDAKSGHRLVIDLLPRATGTTVITAAPAVRPLVEQRPVPRQESAVVSEKPPKRSLSLFKPDARKIVVTIDPGHGGDDPGAIGSLGTREKMVTLAIAGELVQYLNGQDGIRAEITRDSDFFIPLQERRKIAREKHQADLFVSIHADSAPSRQASGASVFALSLKGANTATSRFAQQLAERENKSDLLRGYIAETDDVSVMLAGLTVEGSLNHSLEMGRMILDELRPLVGKLHSPRVEQAGFAVLKEPGMVSLLVETGFISNPEEEERLSDPGYQRDLAARIGTAIVNFCRRFPVPGTYFDQN